MKIEHSQIERAEVATFSFADDWYNGFRNRLAEAQNWRCCYCGVVMNRWRKTGTRCTIEHVIPANAGGRANWETCAAACQDCNRRGGDIIGAEGELPLTVTLCPWCGSNHVRIVQRRAVRCDDCRHQCVLGTLENLPFSRVPFRALRFAVGKMLVANADAEVITVGLLNMLHTRFVPHALGRAMYELAAPAVLAAGMRNDLLVDAYADAVGALRGEYTPKTAAAPERVPLCRDVTLGGRCQPHCLSFDLLGKSAEQWAICPPAS